MKVYNSPSAYKFTGNNRLSSSKTRFIQNNIYFHGTISGEQKCFSRKSSFVLNFFNNITGLLSKLTQNINKSRSLPVSGIDEMLNPDNLYMIKNSIIRKKNNFAFQINGKKIYPEFENSGGTKAVYQAKIDDTPYIIAICSHGDTPELQAQRWRNALNEPRNTEILRNLGFKVNDISEIYPIKINGYDFPAIRMKPYSSHSFQIFDAKKRSNNIDPLINAINNTGDKKYTDFFSQISKEIAVLLSNNILLGSDSINLCLDKGAFHLYFNDLDMKNLFNNDISKNLTKYADYYSNKVVQAFMCCFYDDRAYTTEHTKRIFKKSYGELVEIITKKSLSELESIKKS